MADKVATNRTEHKRKGDPFAVYGDDEAKALQPYWDNVVRLPVKKNGAATAPLDRLAEITVFRSTDEPLGKTMWLDEHGKLMKSPDADMWQGYATRTPVDGANGLADVIRRIGKFEAITHGRLRADLPDKVKVTTKRKLNGSAGIIARDRVHLPLHEEGRVAIALLDYDTHDKPDKIVVKDFWATLIKKVCPALRNAERVTRSSTSAGLYNLKTGDDIPGSSGMHVYVWARDGSDIKRFLVALFERAWLAGYGWIMIAENGKMLERSIIDKTVWKPEGFAFEAPPTLKPPLAQRAEPREPVVIEGEVIDTRTACLSLNAEERARFDELVAAAKEEKAPEAARVKAAYDGARIADLVSRGLPKEKAERQVDAMYREVLLSDTVLLFKTLGERTVKDVLDNPERFHGEYCADPAEVSLGNRDKAQVIQRRGDGNPWIKIYAHGVEDSSYTLQYTDEAKAGMDWVELIRVQEAEALTAELMKDGRIGAEKPAAAEPAAEPTAETDERKAPELAAAKQTSKPLPWIVELGSKVWGPATLIGKEYRFGEDLSKVIDPGKGMWFDFATNKGGGLKDLMKKVEIAGRAEQTGDVDLVNASDVVPRAHEWLWYGHLVRGSQELFSGVPDGGKTTIQSNLVACVTGRKPWPDGAPAIEPMNVIMMTAEDTLADTVIPRLMAAGADLNRVKILKGIKTDEQTKRQFLLSEDLHRLEHEINKIGNVGLVTIDPITAYMGGSMDSYKATEVRSQLGPLKDLAEHTRIALSTITHPAKNAGPNALNHFIGSQGFIAASRVGTLVIEEMEDDGDGGKPEPTGRMLYVVVRHAYTGPIPTLVYKKEVVVACRSGEGFEMQEITASRIIWEGIKNISGNAALAAMSSSKKLDEEQVKVQAFLCEMLKGGKEVPAAEIEAAAKAKGFSEKQLRTAREKLTIETIPVPGKMAGGRMWKLSKRVIRVG
jgi:putative DNA primase/helicase